MRTGSQTASIEIEAQGDGEYVVRLHDTAEDVESWFEVSPGVLEQLGLRAEDEEDAVRRTVEFLIRHQDVADFPRVVDLEDVLAAYPDYPEAVRGAHQRDTTTSSSAPRHTLAMEHADLLREVDARRERVLATLDRGQWPRAEIEALLGYLRYELLDQAVHEERLLYPLTETGFADARVRELTTDHARLRDCADALAAAAACDNRDSQRLTTILSDLHERLTQHLRREREVLSPATDSGIEQLRRPYRSHGWYALTEGSEVDLDRLPRGFAVAAVMDRLTRLRPAEGLELSSSHALTPVRDLIVRQEMAADYGWEYLDEGPQRWRAAITRRSTTG